MATNTFTQPLFNGAALAVSTSTPPASGSFPIAGRMEAFNQFTVNVVTTGSPASYSVQLQGSLDGVTWNNVGSAITADGFYAVSVSNQYYPFIRGNITAVSGGTSPTIKMIVTASS